MLCYQFSLDAVDQSRDLSQLSTFTNDSLFSCSNMVGLPISDVRMIRFGVGQDFFQICDGQFAGKEVGAASVDTAIVAKAAADSRSLST